MAAHSGSRASVSFSVLISVGGGIPDPTGVSDVIPSLSVSIPLYIIIKHDIYM